MLTGCLQTMKMNKVISSLRRRNERSCGEHPAKTVSKRNQTSPHWRETPPGQMKTENAWVASERKTGESANYRKTLGNLHLESWYVVYKTPHLK